MNQQLALPLAFALLASALTLSASAQTADEVLVRGPEVMLTRADYDAELTRIPNDKRIAFATNPQRVQAALNNILVNRTLAERARAQGIDKDPTAARRLLLESDRALAALMVERIESDAEAEFDRAKDSNLARARELYLVDRAKYMNPEEIEVSHILFATSRKGEAAALAAASGARAKLIAGANFADMAVELSDDRSAVRNKGRLPVITAGKVDPAFEKAAAALKSPGDISEPVLSRFGYHVIRLEARKPGREKSFDEVRSQILTEMRQKQVTDARESAIVAIRSDSRLQVNQEAVDALVVQVDVPPLPADSSKPKVTAPAPTKKKK